jgi:coenzyme F420-reducing hydrogenase alpha subunit
MYNDNDISALAAAAEPSTGPKRIDVHHLTRVEGHGNIVVRIAADGTVEQCRWEVSEAPRFFEAMLLGRDYQDVHHITSRICGICSIGHQVASLQATEQALNIRVSEQTLALRKLALHAENLQSHLLHIGFLALPDYMGVPSTLHLAETHREEVLNLIACRRMSNEFSRLVCGRTTHPQRFVPGGFARLPSMDDLHQLRVLLAESLPGLGRVIDLCASLRDRVPAFERETEYIALAAPSEYPLYWGHIGSSMDDRRPVDQYEQMTREYLVRQSTAKWTRNKAESFMVGALSRFNLNHAQLTEGARKAAEVLGLAAPCHNPFLITLAQLVECVHSVEDSLFLVDGLLSRGLRHEATTKVKLQAGRGASAVEVPRGILFHAYEYDEQGRVVSADCVIPTNQNHANIQKDMEALTPRLSGLPESEIERLLSMLVRAYDPCISCSTHLLETEQRKAERPVRFVRT